ncbi:Uncharacterised protein [Vibrio cholerae]|nr:Uncharacterised protein [Vibrio cholerae]
MKRRCKLTICYSVCCLIMSTHPVFTILLPLIICLGWLTCT